MNPDIKAIIVRCLESNIKRLEKRINGYTQLKPLPLTDPDPVMAEVHEIVTRRKKAKAEYEKALEYMLNDR